MAILRLKDTDAKIREFELSKHRPCRIGRAEDNDIVLISPDKTVSSYHAFIKFEAGYFVIVDGGLNGKRSVNHVFINGKQTLEQRLSDGDLIEIAGYTLLFFKIQDDAEIPDDDVPGRLAPPPDICMPMAVSPEPAFKRRPVPKRFSAHPRIPAMQSPYPSKDIDSRDFLESPVSLPPGQPDIFSLKSIGNTEAQMLIQNAGISKASRCSDQSAMPGGGDIVNCTVFAPPSVNPQTDPRFLVQVFVHLAEQTEIVKQLAKEFDESAERRACRSLETQIERGSKLLFQLSIPTLTVTASLQSLIWSGNPDAVQFPVDIPLDAMSGHKVGTLTISQDAIPIGQISFTLKVAIGNSSIAPDIAGEAAVYKKAFISYASSDRNEVLKRVQMLARLHIEFFQDLLSIEPGQQWEKEIYRHIDESDVFFLFWSSAAKSSAWVKAEIDYAIKRKNGLETIPPAIIPIIIEGPPPVSPPDALAHLQFNDYLMYLQQ